MFRTFSIAAMLAVLAAASFFGGAVTFSHAQSPMILHRGNGAEPESLDPLRAEGQWENHIIGDMMLALYTEDAEANPIPGAASSYEVSPDGLTWTFRLRDHSWSDGVPVTADDFVFAYRRILDPANAGKYASILFDIKNARLVNEGKLPVDALGVSAIDAKTLSISLEHPAPYLLQMVMHQTWFPVPKHKVEELGDDWVKAGNYVSNGPYVLAEWRPNDRVKLVKSPTFYDAANVKIDEIYFYPTEDTTAAVKRFRAGELDTQDQVSSQDVDWIKANLPGQLKLEPYLALSYIAINMTYAPLSDIRVREAINLAFDRETIATKLLNFEEAPAYAVVPAKVADWPGGNALSFKDLPYPDRVARAKQLMEEAGYGPGNRLALRYEHGPQPDNKRIAAAFQAMMREIYVDLELRQSETKTLYVYLQEGDFQLGQAAWVGDFNDAYNFLFLFESDNHGLNYGRWKNPDYDALIDKAQNTVDGKERQAIMAQAEKIILDQFAFIPNRFLNTRNLVSPRVKGWITNIRDINRTRWLSVEQPS
ncbi:MAG: peptide ABC transporter substrate-binding protein [Alphaproteobacteria bacterium]|nr:peptide ABC transporter substrate-binding protein [Alphaproteobacteria bacterium]